LAARRLGCEAGEQGAKAQGKGEAQRHKVKAKKLNESPSGNQVPWMGFFSGEGIFYLPLIF
jgi:hypothetical protein